MLISLETNGAQRTSVQSGNWTTPATWDCNCVPDPSDDAIITTGHTVTLTNSSTINILSIQSLGALDVATYDLTITGDLAVDGSLDGFGDIILSGNNSNIDGTGIITSLGDIIIENDKSILSTATIALLGGDLVLDGDHTITNNGIISVAVGNITATDEDAKWVNAANATLYLANALFPGDGKLDASASGNTVSYYKNGAQNIKDPTNEYYHLTLSTSGKKSLTHDIEINGNLSITGTAQLDCNDRSISLAGNWVNNSSHADPFLEQTAQVVYDGGSAQTITNSNGEETYYTMEINKSANDVSLNDNITITNQTTLNSGNLILGNNTLTLDVNASFDEESSSSYVLTGTSGKIKHNINSTGDITFPLGTNLDFSPLNISINNYTGIGSEYLEVQLDDVMHPFMSGGDYITKYWTLNSGNISTINYTIDYEYGDADITGSENNLNAVRWNGSGWASYDPVDAPNNLLEVTTAITNVPINHEFTGGSGSALPIELLSFSGKPIGNAIEIFWATATEINNDFFTIERSTNGNDFDLVGNIDGAGTSYTTNNYFFIDENPNFGTSYYRLKQTDFDGHFEYSEIIAVKSNIQYPLDKEIKVIPNPVMTGQGFTIELPGIYKMEKISIRIYNSFGKIVFETSAVSSSQEVLVTADSQINLPAGIYFVTTSAEGSSSIKMQKFVIQSNPDNNN